MTPTHNFRSRWALWLAAAAIPVLILAGVAGALLVSGTNPDGDESVVAADRSYGAGARPLVEASSMPHESAPSTTSTLAVPTRKAPVRTTAPPAPPTTPTTGAPAPTTAPPAPVEPTPAPAPAPAPAPPTTAATTASVTIVSQFPSAVRLTINGTTYALAAGQEMTGVPVVPAPSGNDVIELALADVPTCGIGDAMGYFRAGARYRLTVIAGPGGCSPDVARGPDFRITPA